MVEYLNNRSRTFLIRIGNHDAWKPGASGRLNKPDHHSDEDGEKQRRGQKRGGWEFARRTFTSRAADVGNALASHPVQRNGPLADESIRPLAVSQCCHSQFNPVRSTVPTNATHPCRCRRPSPRSPWARSVRTCLFRPRRSVPRGDSFPETTLPAVRWRHTRRNKNCQ
jgi:hypothetical protein